MVPQRFLQIGLLLLSLFFLEGCDGFLHIRGVVRDTAGKPIPNARVALTHGEGRKFEDMTDSNGCFSAGGTIAPGRYKYDLRIEANGYIPVIAEIETLANRNVVVILAREGSSGPSQTKEADQIPCRE